ncbi:MAG: hypothetical protein KDC92_16270 [Bacteroidetes bacterium]|nr:hypothetical protein [Bacteroidota bacterium]
MNKPLNFDEVDYVNAAQKGIINNATGGTTLNLFEYIELGKAKVDKNPNRIIELSKQLPHPNNDVFMLRHYHPPLFAYWLNVFSAADSISTQDKVLRVSGFIGAMLTFLSLCFLVWRKQKNRGLGLIIVAIFVASGLTIDSFDTLNFHLALGITSIGFAIALSSYLKHKTTKWILVLGATSAVMLSSLESGLFFLGAAFLGLILTGQLLKVPLKHWLFLSGSFSLVTLIIWPSFFINGEFIKSFGQYFYRIFGKSNAEYESVSYLSGWMNIIRDSPVLFGVLASFAGISLVQWKKSSASLKVLVITGLLYAVMMTPFILNSTYVYPPVVLLTAAAIWHLKEWANNPPLLYVFLAAFVLGIPFKTWEPVYTNESLAEFKAEVAAINELTSHGKVLCIEGQVYQRYCDNAENIENLDSPLKNKHQFTIRYDYLHADIGNEIQSGKYQGVLIRNREYFNRFHSILEEWGFKKALTTSRQVYFIRANGTEH